MDLEAPNFDFKPARDPRRHMPEPPPVRLVAVADVHLPAAAGVEAPLDDFYTVLLPFEREAHDQGHVIYKAENYRLIFDIHEPPLSRDELRPTEILIRSLSVFRQQLIDREIEHEWQKGLTAGTHHILLQDPAGNWLAIGEWREMR